MNAIANISRKGRKILVQDMQAWNVSLAWSLVFAVLPVAALIAFTATVPFFELFLWVVDEDSLLEWSQFLLIIASSLIFAVVAFRLFTQHHRLLALLYLLLALGAFFVAGEEISWGQRIFGWSTPQALQEINAQQETTIHNISWAHQAFINLMMLCGMYGSLAPIVVSLVWPKRRSWLSNFFLPPIFLAPAFFMPFGYRLVRQLFRPELLFPRMSFVITEFSEFTELCLYFGLVIFGLLLLQQLRQAQPHVELSDRATILASPHTPQ